MRWSLRDLNSVGTAVKASTSAMTGIGNNTCLLDWRSLRPTNPILAGPSSDDDCRAKGAPDLSQTEVFAHVHNAA